MARCGGTYKQILIWALVLGIVGPLPPAAASPALGTARGIRSVELSLDGGRNWLPLGSGGLPVFRDTLLRSTTGGALVDLADGSRIVVFPFSSIALRETGLGTEVSVAWGRLGFRLPEQSRLAIVSDTARLRASGKGVAVGEAFVDRGRITGVRMSRGQLQVLEPAARRDVLLASGEPVFLPRPPALPGPFFSSDVPLTPPRGTRGVFNPAGESVGYLESDGRLVVQPGFTSDLARPLSPRIVQSAMARIPARDLDTAMPVFDLNGRYAGYVAGPVFHGEAQILQAATTPAPDDAAAAGAEGGAAGTAGAAGSAFGWTGYLGLVGVLAPLGIAVGVASTSTSSKQVGTAATATGP